MSPQQIMTTLVTKIVVDKSTDHATVIKLKYYISPEHCKRVQTTMKT